MTSILDRGRKFQIFFFALFVSSIMQFPVYAKQSRQILIEKALVKISETGNVPAENSGVITKLLVAEGQQVKAGEVIAQINSDALTLRLERARFEHELAKMAAESQVDFEYSKKSFEVAMSDLRRSQQANMRVSNSVPEAKLEKQQLERDRAELKLEQAKRDLETAAYRTKITSNEIKAAQAELEKTQIKASMSGLVVAVEKRKGEWVDSSQTVCKIVRTDRLKMEGFITAEEASLVRNGMSVRVRFAQPWLAAKKGDWQTQGKLVFISPEANPVNLLVQVWVEIPNADGSLSAGLRGDIAIEIE
ncbi:MAG: efflux RND transporter periplasmic adaptor subunit [Mariniblastus sp.]